MWLTPHRSRMISTGWPTPVAVVTVVDWTAARAPPVVTTMQQMASARNIRRAITSSPSTVRPYRNILPLMRFAPEYVSNVLNENFEDAKELLLTPLMAIHHAHLVMLAEQGIICERDARALRAALAGISLESVRRTS